MIDWHSHILPAMDDGSRDVEESFAMVEALSVQNVDTVIATPHFYADDETVTQFLHRRDAAKKKLDAALPSETVRILCGAEVRYYPGISRMTDLTQLCIEGTDLLLLEMSSYKWSEYTVGELIELASSGNVTLILAHVERYMDLQSADVQNRLLRSGVLMQSNASPFLHFRTKKRSLYQLRTGQLHLLGSDCHNMTSRKPRLGEAAAVIQRKLGNDFLKQMDDFGKSLLKL